MPRLARELTRRLNAKKRPAHFADGAWHEGPEQPDHTTRQRATELLARILGADAASRATAGDTNVAVGVVVLPAKTTPEEWERMVGRDAGVQADATQALDESSNIDGEPALDDNGVDTP